MEFKKYQHIERFGTSEVDGIELGRCYLFPKIDGTNGSAWLTDHGVRFGSRKQSLTPDYDNAGFYRDMAEDRPIKEFFVLHPNLRLFGEWLVPHSLKTYRQEAWRKFYVFDVTEDLPEELPSGEKFRYLSYEEYQPMIEEVGLDYIPPLAIIQNPDYDKIVSWLDRNQFLVEDGKGAGEGIVVKNYDFKNRYGRTTWAKIVTSEFKEKHTKEMGAPDINGKEMVEQKIADKYCTEALIEKSLAKIKVECEGWHSRLIPRLLGTVYHELVIEECWNFVKEFKNPKVNFKTLHSLCIIKIKQTMPELF